MTQIRVAFAGVGNCTSAFIQGVQYYRETGDTTGLLYPEIAGYKPSDIVSVAAFDVDARKVGKDLSEAIFAEPNCTLRFMKVPHLGVEVQMGPILDGVPDHLRGFVEVAPNKPVDVVDVLVETKTDVLINVLPTGSRAATRAYADAAIRSARTAFVNGIPEMIANDPDYAEAASNNKVPIVGDDFKSQVGTTIFHQALISAMIDRGVRIDRMYQYNFAGNTDFANLENRGESKEESKRSALMPLLPYEVEWGFAPMFIRGQDDIKTGVIHIDGSYWGRNKIKVDLTLQVNDSADAAGVMIDMVRFAKAALDGGLGGVLTPVCAYYAKHPPRSMKREDARCELDSLAGV